MITNLLFTVQVCGTKADSVFKEFKSSEIEKINAACRAAFNSMPAVKAIFHYMDRISVFFQVASTDTFGAELYMGEAISVITSALTRLFGAGTTIKFAKSPIPLQYIPHSQMIDYIIGSEKLAINKANLMWETKNKEEMLPMSGLEATLIHWKAVCPKPLLLIRKDYAPVSALEKDYQIVQIH